MIRRGLPPRFADADMEKLHGSFECVRNYMEGIRQHVRAGEGLFLSGPPGVGKTYAIAALTKEASVRQVFTEDGVKKKWQLADWVFATGPSLFESYALPYDAGGKDQTELLEKAQWLVVNDLGKEYRGGAYEKQVPYKLGRLLRARVEARLVTHITTNLILDEDEEHPGMSIMEIYGESTYSLLKEACPLRYLVNGPDRRQQDKPPEE